jgi:hypothetical protein
MIVALQYHEADLERTASLARLLADLEPYFRFDVLLALVCQPGTPRPPLVTRTVAHCRRRFPVEEVVSEYGATGYPQGCNELWRGTASHYFRKYRMDGSAFPTTYATSTPHAGSLLTLDGGDGVPLHPDWLDRMIALHIETLTSGKLITGTPHFLGTCPLHVNPNAVFELDVFYRTKFRDHVPPYTDPRWVNFAFDVYHRVEMLEHACLSSAVRTDWRSGGQPASRDLLLDRSRQSLWLHGYKDADLCWIARDHLSSRPAPPELCFYDMEQLRLQERVRRSYEETQALVPAAKIFTPSTTQ